jgi:hypothetical protein
MHICKNVKRAIRLIEYRDAYNFSVKNYKRWGKNEHYKHWKDKANKLASYYNEDKFFFMKKIPEIAY